MVIARLAGLWRPVCRLPAPSTTLAAGRARPMWSGVKIVSLCLFVVWSQCSTAGPRALPRRLGGSVQESLSDGKVFPSVVASKTWQQGTSMRTPRASGFPAPRPYEITYEEHDCRLHTGRKTGRSAVVEEQSRQLCTSGLPLPCKRALLRRHGCDFALTSEMTLRSSVGAFPSWPDPETAKPRSPRQWPPQGGYQPEFIVIVCF